MKFTYSGIPATPFIQFARRILSITANSASCERLFSVFGATLTKHRTKLSTQTLTHLSKLKMHVRDEHIKNGEAKARLKRQFGKINEPGIIKSLGFEYNDPSFSTVSGFTTFSTA